MHFDGAVVGPRALDPRKSLDGRPLYFRVSAKLCAAGWALGRPLSIFRRILF